ncbi:hypothetical protein BD626DRAFT_409302 [Schizophyllum amplum]|uniref:Tetratricopeptide repeat protein 39B n=1 Tax=Schizophyllum amplum TaxID=97359 RepID=A0A550C371_9AGAR|nr:hypothetical protein BD626DRAFT_409302 [Auriculariopsis ampla]
MREAEPTTNGAPHPTAVSKQDGAAPSYQSAFTGGPPPVRTPYKHNHAIDDIKCVAYALELFLASHMHESEEYCDVNDKKKERMYFATGYGLIQCIKGLMSYEDEDLLAGITHTKRGITIASAHRKKAPSMTTRLAGLVVSSLSTSSVAWIKSMTLVERHAELTYTETMFEKSLLGIVYSGDWLAFIREILNMRTIMNTYRQLGKFVETMDEEGKGNEIDAHFRSGVYLGVGASNLILSLMPARLLTIVELFGYKGDRKFGLEMLQKAGGWTVDSDEPGVSARDEGLRRSICDMVLLMFHLVLSSFTIDCVDLSMAQKILDWNLKRYPDSVFFQFGAGRLSLVRSQPKKAIAHYTKAREVQTQYKNLHHVSYWEIALADLALWDAKASLDCWKILEEQATWSKCIYSYGYAVCLLESAASGPEGDEDRKTAAALLAQVPNLRQRIAGKSIPLEKFFARKARKFQLQNGRLALPALEAAYIWLTITHAPRYVLTERMLPAVWTQLAALGVAHAGEEGEKPSDARAAAYGAGFWDDFALSRFLEGVCLRYVAYPGWQDPDAIPDPEDPVGTAIPDAGAHAVAAFLQIFEFGPKIELDHHIVYHAHYEYGRLLACQGDKTGAQAQFDLVQSGKPLEVNAVGRKGKYSMENALMMRTHAAVEALQSNRL